jgi:hypothetical protein
MRILHQEQSLRDQDIDGPRRTLHASPAALASLG